jgi:sulfate/thiosulfate transport system ATP-binding protein
MDFLGNVNVFKGRVERGRAVVPGLDVAYPEYPHAEARDAAVYIRPHEFTIENHVNGGSSIAATVLHVHPTGSRTKVELRAVDFDLLISAEISDERSAELGLKVGDTVHVSPRRVRVFMP